MPPSPPLLHMMAALPPENAPPLSPPTAPPASWGGVVEGVGWDGHHASGRHVGRRCDHHAGKW
eukprot:10789996-Alexandrium_andersonii.AAC.1